MPDNNRNPQDVLASMFVGTAISFVLHGIVCCQTLWYFRTQSDRSSKSMKALIWFIWLGETLNCVFMYFEMMNSLIIIYTKPENVSCRHWTGPAQAIATGVCTFSVEAFFIMRMWRLSQNKKLTALALAPFLMGHGFGCAQFIRIFQTRCNLTVSRLDESLVLGCYGCRVFSDGVVAFAMCCMLYVRSSGFTRHTNTVKLVRGLILWSMSTGLLMCFSNVLVLASYLSVGNLPPVAGIYYIRSGLYVNAMLAQLNDRTRFRTMANPTTSLGINLNTMSSAQRVTRESQRSVRGEPIPE